MKNILLFLFIIINTLANAQRVNYKEIDLPAGVQAAQVQFLYTDQNGFVWLAAGSMVYWHDGNGFRQLDYRYEGEAIITSLYQDNSGTFWIGWSNGNIYNWREEVYSQALPEEGTPKVEIIAWAEDEAGQLWYATKGEGVFVKNDDGRWFNFSMDDGLPSDEIYEIVAYHNGIAIATDQGLAIISFIDNKKEVSVYDRKNGLSDQIVKSICADGDLLAAYFDPYVNVIDNLMIVTDTLDAPEEDAKKIWRSAQLKWWLSESGTLYRKVGYSPWEPLKLGTAKRDRIKTFVEDHEGHLWILSSRGLFIIDEWYYHNPTENTVSALWGDGSELWYAQQGKLFFKDLANGETMEILDGENLILSLCKDSWGTIWFGTFDGGLHRYYPQTGKLKTFTEAQGLSNNNVLSISGTKYSIWVGTLGGVSRLDLDSVGEVETINSYDENHGVSVQYIYSIEVSTDGSVYLGTDGEGVLKWNGSSFMSLSEKLSDEVVLDVAVDNANNVWWVNAKGVLSGMTSSGEIMQPPKYPEEPGKVSGLQTLEDGSVLVIHEGGLHRWLPEAKSWMAYKKSFGFADLRPELHSYVLVDGDILYIGSSVGITSIIIDELPKQAMPETRIGKAELYFKPTSQANFSSSDNHLTFKYIGRWYGEPTSVRYSIKLDGFDPDWIESKNTEITYPKLPPGEYTFNVIAGVDGYYPREQLRQISFVINKPWYARWYSIVAAILILSGVLIILFRVRLKMLQQSQEREKQKVESQLETLKSQVNPHFLFNSFNTLMALIEDDKEEATEYLSDLSDFFRSILEFRDVDLISVREDVKIVETYLQLQSKRFGENLVATIDLTEEALASKIPPLTLQLLVENAFKHNVISRDKPLELRIDADGEFIRVMNKYHPRPKTEDSTGYGLDSIKKKYKYYSGGKSVEVLHNDVNFEVHLPVIYKN